MFSHAIERFKQRNHYPGFAPRAVLFDMDGVLFDSMRGHATAWVKAMREMDLPFSELDAYMNEGQTGHATINNVFLKKYGRDATEEEKQQVYQLKSDYFDDCGTPAPMPYAFELLQKLKARGLQRVVVTGSGQPSLLNRLEHSFPGMFTKDKMVTAFDVQYGKPHPEPYLMGLKKTGLQPWEVVAVDNAPLGVESASAARLFTIGLNTGPLPPQVLVDAGADIILGGMKELYDRWDEIVEVKV